jgi:hypothetical protein
MKPLLVVALIAILSLSACIPPNFNTAPPAPAPCQSPVAAIRNTSNIVVATSFSYSYTPTGGNLAYTEPPKVAIYQLNEDGKADGNTFVLPNGQPTNFTFAFTVDNPVYNSSWTGSLTMSGWGFGFIHTFTTANPYSSPTQMIQDLTDQAYVFIHSGWHDARSSCPQQ